MGSEKETKKGSESSDTFLWSVDFRLLGVKGKQYIRYKQMELPKLI